MFYLGSYKLENIKNILSIPEHIILDQKKNNGVVFVISDTLFSSEQYDLSSSVMKYLKRTFTTIVRHLNVFDNVEAIVLNGNIIKNKFNKQFSSTTNRDDHAYNINRSDFSYSFLSSLLRITKNTPIFYVRGCYDCYINNNVLPPELRGDIKFCNSLQIGRTLFLHGHTSLDLFDDSEKSIVCDLNSRNEQENIGLQISKDLNVNVVLSNSNFTSYQNGRLICVGSFLKNGLSVINLSPFEISDLTFCH